MPRRLTASPRLVFGRFSPTDRFTQRSGTLKPSPWKTPRTLMDIFADIDALLETAPDVFIAGEKSPEMVEAAETRLGISLPVSFKTFLRKYGNLSFGSTEYYGLTANADFDKSSVPDFVWFTLRRTGELPAGYAVFRSDNGEQYACLDTGSLDESGECPVVLWDVIDRDGREVPMNFAEFLKEELTEYVSGVL